MINSIIFKGKGGCLPSFPISRSSFPLPPLSSSTMQIASSFVLLLAICIQPYRGSSAFAPSHSKWSSGWCVNTRTPIQMAVDGASSKERKPWDVLRFINQSSKFVTPPKLPFIGATSDEKVTVQPGQYLIYILSSVQHTNQQPTSTKLLCCTFCIRRNIMDPFIKTKLLFICTIR